MKENRRPSIFTGSSENAEGADNDNPTSHSCPVPQLKSSNDHFNDAIGIPKPDWIRPEMLFPKECIEIKSYLGCGGFGMVHKAVVRYGPAA